MNCALILAGGRGSRMKAEKSKQYIDVCGRPVLYYTLKKFINNSKIHKIILVIPKDEEEYCRKEVLSKYGLNVDKIIYGGKERQDSVYNGLKEAQDSDIVLIHDAARPFVTDSIIEEGIKFAEEYGAASPGVMPKDTIKVQGSDGFSEKTLKRSELVAIQTPQVFKTELIINAHKKIKEENIPVTDDTMAAELSGHRVFIYPGDYNNIKITTPEDLILAEYLAESDSAK